MMKRRALIVNADGETCAAIQRAVSSAGIEIQIAATNLHAEQLLDDGKFDLVFLDFAMSREEALRIARQIRRSRKNKSSTIVLLSDDQRPGALTLGFEAGATFFVYKPVDKANLRRLIGAVQGSIDNDVRRTRRVPTQNSLQLRCGDQEIAGVTVDMSLCGILVKAERTFPLGSVVSLKLNLPNGSRPVSGKGCVTRVTAGNEMGIQIDRMALSESEKLQEFLLPLIPENEALPALK
jgi:DNA-binding response OmpR family regulator